MLAFVWFSKAAVDCATGRVQSVSGLLVMWFALMVVCMLSDLLLAQCVRYMEARASVLMTNRVNRRLFNVLMSQPLVNGKHGFHSGDMLNRLTLDVRTVASFAITQLPLMVVMVVQLMASFVFLAWLSPYLAFAPIIIMPLCLLAGKLYFRRQRALTAEMRHCESDIHVTIQEGLRHRVVVKALECLDEIDRRIGGMQKQLDAANKTQTKLSAVSGALTRFGFVAGFLTAFGWGVFSLQAGVITFGTMTAFLQLVNRIQTPIANLASYMPLFISASVAIDRLEEIDVAYADETQNDSCQPLARAGVRVKDLTFRYEADGKNVISRLSYDFTPGSRTMVVGSTGVGKTTLIKLLLGLLRPHSGEVEIYGDGEERPVSSATLCNYVYVPQGHSLFHGSIRDNLLLASPQATDDQMAKALHTAVADFVFDLPQGLDTSCDEAGGGLSEGQAQRIAIARSLLRPGSILLLDEFNSALDAATAATLMKRISQSYPDSTIIVIAHHHSEISPFCDAVLRIEAI